MRLSGERSSRWVSSVAYAAICVPKRELTEFSENSPSLPWNSREAQWVLCPAETVLSENRHSDPFPKSLANRIAQFETYLKIEKS